MPGFNDSTIKYKGNSNEILQDFEKIILVLFIDERWIAALLELKTNKAFLVDFLDPELSRINS